MNIEPRMYWLNINKSAEVDNIHIKVLQELNIVLAVPLKKVFENSLQYKYLCENWRAANEAQYIRKEVNKMFKKNYRP